jgi:hypothetical protein
VFDGTDNLRDMTALATLGWPTGGAFEVWALVEWTGGQLGGGSLGYVFTFPVNASTTSFLLGFVGVGTPLRMSGRLSVGNGSAGITAVDTANILTGRHILRAVSTGTTIRLDVDGVTGAPVACVAAFSGTPRNTIGASPAATANNFFTGKLNFLGFYRPLPESYAAGLYEALVRRRG